MKKITLLTIFIVLLSITTISAAPSTTAGNGGLISTITPSVGGSDILSEKTPDLNNIPSSETKQEIGFTTLDTKVNDQEVIQNIVKPGINSDVVINKQTGITTIDTVTEYGSSTKTIINNNTGITTTNTVKKDGTTIDTIKDINDGISTTIETKKDGHQTTTVTSLDTGVSTSTSLNEDGSTKKVIIVPSGAPAPEGLTTTQTNNVTSEINGSPLTLNIENAMTVFVADVFELKVNEQGEELISSTQKYVEITKIPLALDEKSKETEDIRSKEITLVPKDEIITKIDKSKLAPSVSYITKDSYMSDFYELQVYLKDGDQKELTHEGLQVTIKLPEYITDDVDDTRSGVVHYEQEEGIYEFVLFDNINYETKEVTFTLRSTSPISYVFKYKTNEALDDVVVRKCYIHWIILLTILIYVVAALLIVNKKKHLKYASLLEALISTLLALYTKELWCMVMMIIALLVIVIMTLLIKKANKEEQE